MTMSRWFRVYDDLVDDPKVQRLTAAAFKEAFYRRLNGETNEFCSFIKEGRNRSGAEWKRLRKMVFERDDFTCQYCFKRGGRLECDHMIPVSRGGTDDPKNLATACFSCNRSKRAKTPAEWLL